MEFVCKIHVGKTTVEILERVKTMFFKLQPKFSSFVKLILRPLRSQPGQFQDRIIFMSMYDDIEFWEKEQPKTSVGTTQHKSPSMQEISNQDTGHVLDLEKRISGMEA